MTGLSVASLVSHAALAVVSWWASRRVVRLRILALSSAVQVAVGAALIAGAAYLSAQPIPYAGPARAVFAVQAVGWCLYGGIAAGAAAALLGRRWWHAPAMTTAWGAGCAALYPAMAGQSQAGAQSLSRWVAAAVAVVAVLSHGVGIVAHVRRQPEAVTGLAVAGVSLAELAVLGGVEWWPANLVSVAGDVAVAVGVAGAVALGGRDVRG